MAILILFVLTVVAIAAYYFGRWVVLTSLTMRLPERGSNFYWEQNAWLRTRNPKTAKKDDRKLYFDNGFSYALSEVSRMVETHRWWTPW